MGLYKIALFHVIQYLWKFKIFAISFKYGSLECTVLFLEDYVTSSLSLYFCLTCNILKSFVLGGIILSGPLIIWNICSGISLEITFSECFCLMTTAKGYCPHTMKKLDSTEKLIIAILHLIIGYYQHKKVN